MLKNDWEMLEKMLGTCWEMLEKCLEHVGKSSSIIIKHHHLSPTSSSSFPPHYLSPHIIIDRIITTVLLQPLLSGDGSTTRDIDNPLASRSLILLLHDLARPAHVSTLSLCPISEFTNIRVSNDLASCKNGWQGG